MPDRAYLDARIMQARVADEHVRTTLPPPPVGENRQLQIRVQLTTQFHVSLNDPENPTELLIELSYEARLMTTAEPSAVIGEYTARHVCQFQVIEKSGFDWNRVSEIALAPYFSVTHMLAKTRAEEALLRLGFYGVTLPKEISVNMNQESTNT